MKRALAVVALVALSPLALVAVLTAPPDHLEEDEYGWNCWTMGNHSCGSEPLSAIGCVTLDDGYTMCRDGRVFMVDADGRPIG